jgi:hypothetical protein
VDLEEWVEDLNRQVTRLEREVAAVLWLLDGSASQKRAAKLLLADGHDERIAKYERHLHSHGTCTRCSRPPFTNWSACKHAARVRPSRPRPWST